jgi:hypothetical protein
MSTSHDYLDEPAAKLALTYPDCSDYVSELLTKYKKALADGSLSIGSTAEDVILSFENDVRKRCLRNKADSAG